MDVVSENLKTGIALHARGDLAGARVEGEAAYRSQPDNALACQFLGVVYCQMGELTRGADMLGKALSLQPENLKTRLNLAKALMGLGRLEEADVATLPAAQGAPASPDLWRMRGDVLKARGRLGEAIAAYQHAIDLRPDYFEAVNNLGNALRINKEPERALSAFERARALKPNLPLIHLNYARALRALERNAESLEACQQAVKLAPRDPDALVELGKALNILARYDEALVALHTARGIRSNDAELFTAIGIAEASLLRAEDAEAAYRHAIALRGSFSLPYFNLGILLEQGNRLEELEALLNAARSAGAEMSDLTILDALLLRRRGELEAALELAQSAPIFLPIVAELCAELIGQAADRLGDPEKAFAAFTEMNRLAAGRPSAQGVDKLDYRRRIEQLIAVLTPEWVAGWKPIKPDSARRAPVFLIGFPRSGTTLLDTVLMGHTRVKVLEELSLLRPLHEAAGEPAHLAELDTVQANDLRARYFRELDTLVKPAPGDVVIDKMPLYIAQTAFIARLFPEAKIIFSLRHPCDVVLSCFMQNFRVTSAMANFHDLKDAATLYDLVMTYWTRCQELLPLDVHTVRYESTIAEMEGEIRPLIEFLGLPWESAVLDHQKTGSERGRIHTPSYSQVVERTYTRAAGRWERYRDHLKEALPILEPWVRRFNYEPL
jgi:tetratricopeptide (TPR) repeat protein